MTTIQNTTQSALNTNDINALSTKLGELGRTLEALIKLLSQLGEDQTVSNLSNNEKAQVATKFTPRSSGGGASKRAGAYAGPAGFLWKPVSDSTGKLAVLLPPGMTGSVRGVSILGPDGRVLEQGRDGGVGNGGREHFRFSKPGGSYPPGSQVAILMNSGATQRITIEKPGVRTEGR